MKIIKILKILEKESKAGAFICNNLNITKEELQNYIKDLKQKGYDISIVDNKYYLNKKEMYNDIELKKGLKTNIFGKSCFFFNQIDSTNVYANKIAVKAKEGTVVFADYQTEGKGRFCNKWYSEKGAGIYLSIILKPALNIQKINIINLITAISICNMLKSFNITAYIKWPNDIILNNKKLGGILSQLNYYSENEKYIVVGVGLNINNQNFGHDINQKATSLFLQYNQNFDRIKIMQTFLQILENMYFEYLKNKSFNIFLEEYKNLCLNLNKEVMLFYENEKLVGKIIDITENGELIFLKNDKKIKITSGEVSIRNKDGGYI